MRVLWGTDSISASIDAVVLAIVLCTPGSKTTMSDETTSTSSRHPSDQHVSMDLRVVGGAGRRGKRAAGLRMSRASLSSWSERLIDQPEMPALLERRCTPRKARVLA